MLIYTLQNMNFKNDLEAYELELLKHIPHDYYNLNLQTENLKTMT